MAHFTLEEVKKPKRRMIQPTKDYIRAELKLAEAEIEHLHTALAEAKQPWWKRLSNRITQSKPFQFITNHLRK